MTLRLVTAGTAAVVPALLAFRSGGYFPSEWGLQLGFFALVVVLVVIVADGISVEAREIVVVLSLLGLAAWSLVSIAWSPAADGPVQAAERTLVYVAALGALLVAVTQDRVPWLLGGALAGISVVCLYALGTRVLAGSIGDPSDAVTGTRLAAPIGYTNALGALAALGILLAIGFAFHERVEARVAGSALLVPLAATLYFTLSRGSLIALAVGLIVFLAFESSGNAVGGLALVAVPPAAAVLLAIRSPLLDGGLSAHEARASGHRLALELAGLLVLGGALGALSAPVARRILPVVWVLLGAAAAAGAAAIVFAGPVHLAHRVADSLSAPPPVTTTHASRRLLSSSASGRTEYWRVAAKMIERRPLLGEGAGSYERWWLQDRPVANEARNAHSLYLETLAELGPLGLLLVLLALVPPLLATIERTPLAAGALAAYVAYLVHAALDWDWQIPGVTLVALTCGGALLVLARAGDEPQRLTSRRRALGLAVALPLVAAALLVHVGNRAADRSATALDAGRIADAAAQARRARTWMPWAEEPWRLLGEAQLAARDDGAARASLRRATRRDPDDWLAWYDLATASAGAARAQLLARARSLNPLEPSLR